ncbi:MAG TPA: hypothetical protein VKZ75_10280 [Cyclobacteriaceae bacterium]|jgi:hypothetical protein|nr:hypothetical protein [Cyclobacteriaceae bacterium]
MKKTLFLPVFVFLFHLVGAQRAELHIDNNSMRTLEIKIMKGHPDRSTGLYTKFTINPYGRTTKYFSSTGDYFMKVKAMRPERKPAYSKGDPFRVYVGADGYSVMTITYSIQETTTSVNPLNGETISEAEYEGDY